ncbi:MAG: hypothetical protein H7138_26140 [Myxococcales bacterium]|nr:hypothetical protein [Myxococcales bacterium]
MCTRGFCVERGVAMPGPDAGPDNGCPSGCTKCDLDDRTCDIDCSGARCATAVCPPGFDCTIECMAPGGCDEIDCTGAASCDITCVGLFACPTITCGPGECDVVCAGQTACGLLDCSSACRCDQICTTASSCAAWSCPIVGAELCTEDGNPTSPCDSSAGRDCDRCM